MKISAMPAGSGGTPGVDLGNINVGVTASADRLAAAKAMAQGIELETKEQDPIERARSIRRITMKTNYTTNRDDVATPAAETPAEADTNSTALDTGGQTKEGVESQQPLSPQFAALAKERRALQVMKREIAEEKAKLSQPPEGDYVSKADLISNPLKIFDLGLTYDQLTEAILANQSGITPEIRALKEELKALKEGVDTKFVSQAEAQEESALNQIADDIEALSKEGDDYELFRERGGLQKALNKIYLHYKKTGQVLELKDVMNQIETNLLDDALKVGNIKKVKSKLAPEPVPTEPQSQGKQMKTLTNRDGAGLPLDRRARAIAAMTGQLRK